MHKNKNTRPVLGQFFRSGMRPTRQKPTEIITYDLSIVEPDSGGYDPYDNSEPVRTEVQIAEADRRRALRRRGP